MEALEAIYTRRSVRRYEDRGIPAELLKEVLKAGMYAPSAVNSQPWHFVVVDDRDVLDKIAEIHPYAKMVKQAPMAIVVCADLDAEKFPGRWVLDCSAAVQNIHLAAHALGLATVWVGLYPDEKEMVDFQALLGLPENVKPHTLIPLGYSAEESKEVERYHEERIHRNNW